MDFCLAVFAFAVLCLVSTCAVVQPALSPHFAWAGTFIRAPATIAAGTNAITHFIQESLFTRQRRLNLRKCEDPSIAGLTGKQKRERCDLNEEISDSFSGGVLNETAVWP